MVLFLFVVMMLDINFVELRHGFMQYLPVGALVGIVLLAELVLVFGAWAVSPGASTILAAPLPQPDQVTNTHALGALLYTRYVYAFQAAGVILLVAMIGAIVLTLRHKPGVKRQLVADQVLRTPKTGMRVVSLKPGQGIDQ
jgi:NADH-quinone oxidoreductase subunit J